MRRKFVDWLRTYLPSPYWPAFWLLPPIIAILALPLGSVILEGMAFLNVEGAPRLLQLLMILSILGGPSVGVWTLVFVDFADLSLQLTSKIKWLSRFAVVSPILLLLTLFLIFAKP